MKKHPIEKIAEEHWIEDLLRLRKEGVVFGRKEEQLRETLTKVWNAAIDAAWLECDGERKACHRHHDANPRRLNHKVGIQIASVCAHRVQKLRK